MFRKKLVPDAHAANTLQLLAGDSGCCGQDAYQLCKYTVTVDPFVSFSAIVVEEDGVQTTISLGSTVAVLADVPDAIRAAMKANAFLLDDNPKGEPKDVVIVENGTEVTIDIWSDVEVIQLTEGASTARAATQKCTPEPNCLFSGNFAGDALTASVDGAAAESLGSHAYPGEEAAIQAALEGSTQLSGVTEVTVTDNTTLGVYTITFRFKKSEVALAGVTFAREDCKQDYIV